MEGHRIRERVPLNMFDTIFHYTADPAKPFTDYSVEARPAFLAWCATRYIGGPTMRLFTKASGFGNHPRQDADIGALPNDETMIVAGVTMELLHTVDPTVCRNILDHVTLGLMVNNAYEYLERRGQPEIGCRRFLVLTDVGTGRFPPGAQVAARMGFYVTALIGRKAKETLEDTPGVHLLVRLEGEHTREGIGPVEKGH